MNSSNGQLNYILVNNNESSQALPSKCNLVLTALLSGTSPVNCTFASLPRLVPIWCHRLVSIGWCKLVPFFAVTDWSSIWCHRFSPPPICLSLVHFLYCFWFKAVLAQGNYSRTIFISPITWVLYFLNECWWRLKLISSYYQALQLKICYLEKVKEISLTPNIPTTNREIERQPQKLGVKQ